MHLDGLHHITMITGDAQRNVDFFADVLGLRLVKKTVNFDQPEAYHLYFGDESGAPGSLLTWFEFAGAAPGSAGAGDVHVLELGVAGAAALDVWEERLAGRGVDVARSEDRGDPVLRFADPDGLALVLRPDLGDVPLRAAHPDIPAEHAITGLVGARAYAADPAALGPALTDVLGFDAADETGTHLLRGGARRFRFGVDPAPDGRSRQGAGSVHHIAWASRDEDHLGWRARVAEAGAHVTPQIDRDYFLALYFRTPIGVLFEIATTSPGFATDEAPEHLGETLRLPAQHEPLRGRLERVLSPVVNPRQARETA